MAGVSGRAPQGDRQEEWYRRVFSNALSLSSEAKRFLFCVKEDCLWSVLYAVSPWKRDTFPAKALCSGRRRSPDFPCRPGREMCCWEKLWGCCGQRRTSAGIAGRLRSNTERQRKLTNIKGDASWITTRPSICPRPTSPCGRVCPSGSRRCSSAGRTWTSTTSC